MSEFWPTLRETINAVKMIVGERQRAWKTGEFLPWSWYRCSCGHWHPAMQSPPSQPQPWNPKCDTGDCRCQRRTPTWAKALRLRVRKERQWPPNVTRTTPR